MSELMVSGNTTGRMSSREIAELMEKRHADVLRDIKNLIDQGAINERNFALVDYKDAKGEKRPEYLLDFHATMVLITGYDAKRRALVITRWLELETGEAVPAYKLPGTYAEALRALADESEKSAALQRQIETDRPKTIFADSVSASNKAIDLGDYSKLISDQNQFVIGRNNLYSWLQFEKILKRNNIPYQEFINSGWFEVTERVYETEHSNGPRVNLKTLITGKGQVSVFERIKKSKSFQKFCNKKAPANKNRAQPMW